MHSSTNKSIASMDPSEEYIDLDRVLVEDELRSLVSTPEHQHNQQFKISLKSIDECKTERFRRSLVTPLPKYNHSIIQPEWCGTTNKSSNDSCAESVALFKNLASNEDHIDFVSSDLKEFMSPYDLDDIVSRPTSRVPMSPYRHRDMLTSSRLRNHNMQKTPEPLVEQKPILRHTNNKSYTNTVSHNPPSGMPINRTAYLDETIAIPRKHSFDSIEESRKQSPPSTPIITETSKIDHAALPNQTNNGRLQKILNKRRSVDSDALKKLKSQEDKIFASHSTRLVTDTKLKQPSYSFTDKAAKSKHTSTSTAIPAPTTSSRRASLLRQPDSRRWSSRISEQQIEEIKKSPLISPRQLPINTAKRTNHHNEANLISKKKLANDDRLGPLTSRTQRLPLKSLSDETRHQVSFDTERDSDLLTNIQTSTHRINNLSLINKTVAEEEPKTKVSKENTFRRLVRRDRATEDQHAQEASPISPSISRHTKRLNTLATVNRQRNSAEPTLQRRLNTSVHRHSLSYTNHSELTSTNKEEEEEVLLPSHAERLADTNMYNRRAKPSALTVETSQLVNTIIDHDNNSSYRPLHSEDKLATPLISSPSTRYQRKYGNARYTAENVSSLVDTPSKEVRFSKANFFISHPNDIPIAASQSSGGLSNSTGSSHSGELYYDPPLSANSRSALLSQKRCSIPVLNTTLIDEQVRKSERRYSSYLARIKHEDEPVPDNFEQSPVRYMTRQRPRAISTEEGDGYVVRKNFTNSTLRRPLQRQEHARDEYIPRRRVLSEDNNGIKGQGHGIRQYCTSSSNESSPIHAPIKTSTNQREYEKSIPQYRSNQYNANVSSEEPPRRLQRGTSTENVTESARKVLAFVQQRRSIKHANQQANPNRRSLHF
ncbi:hypothetical protein EDC96DRAFT_515746 [Choanephora cucurbitarum]|nr:hypothetical protein EDC96DRAFT_515746 [Choanephora cucurbitarum]